MSVDMCNGPFRRLETSWRIRSFPETTLTAPTANSTIINCFRIGSSTWHGTTLLRRMARFQNRVAWLFLRYRLTTGNREVDEQSDARERRSRADLQWKVFPSPPRDR